MKPLLLLNDVHLGVQRMAGTTPASQSSLKMELQTQFYDFLLQHLDKDLCILGDLFDGFTVDIDSVLQCYFALVAWMGVSGNALYLVAGNHDIGKRNDRTSSFDVLCTLIESRYPERVVIVRDKLYSRGNIHTIPHCMNQDLFNLELEKALDVEPGYLLLHANVDNGFAEKSDHSLNVDAEWLTRLCKRHTLLFAHEHQHRVVTHYKKPIHVLGNQWPSSIADCLAHGDAQKDGQKFAHIVDDQGIQIIPTWHRDGDFVQMDWTELDETPARFIRITGKAKAEQASDVVSVIAKYRAKSDSFVISNAVQIDGVAGMDALSEVTFESVKAFDVLGALLEHLTPPEANVVRSLLEV